MFGDLGTTELVTVCGFYAWVSYMLNALDVPPPDSDRCKVAQTTRCPGDAGTDVSAPTIAAAPLACNLRIC